MPADTRQDFHNKLFGELDPWDRIDAMPDHRPLKASEAAVFMTFSLSTLERMRVAGTGPDYFQAGMRVDGAKSGSVTGTNQAIRYFKQDIRAWFERNKVSSSMQAAVLKGQAFRTIADIMAEAAFYLDKDGAVAGSVDGTPLSTVLERLGEWDIIWMPVYEAASRPWSEMALHDALAERVKQVLSRCELAIDGALEATSLGTDLPAGSSELGMSGI